MTKKRISIKWLLSCLFLFQAYSLIPAEGKDLKTSKGVSKVVIYSDYDLMRDSLEVKVEEARLKELEDKSRENLKALNDEFMSTAEALNNKDTLTDKAKKELEEKLQKLYQEMCLANQQFEELARQQAMESQRKVEESLNKAVEEFNKANPGVATLNTNRRAISKEADVTEEIVAIMNRNFEAKLEKENAKTKEAIAKKDTKN